MTPTNTTNTTNSNETTGADSVLDALIPPAEPWRPIHIRLPQSTHEVIKVVAARSRRDMTEVIREVMIEWAKGKRAELTEELAAAAPQQVTGKRRQK